jgi:hypothetical protein
MTVNGHSRGFHWLPWRGLNSLRRYEKHVVDERSEPQLEPNLPIGAMAHVSSHALVVR